MPVEREKIDQYIKNGWVDTFRLFHSEGKDIHGGVTAQVLDLEILVGGLIIFL